MAIRAFRFQADIDPVTGLFTKGQMYDEQTAVDPITDEVVGTGRLIGPVEVNDKSHAQLFAALNVQALKASDRLADARAKHVEKLAKQAEELAKSEEAEPVIIEGVEDAK